MKVPEDFAGCIAIPRQDSMRLYVDRQLVICGWNF